jgi:hypothetical protein
MGGTPKEAVVDDQQIRVGVNGLANCSKAGVNRGGDFRNRSHVFDLQSVYCAIVILDFGDSEKFVAVMDDSGQYDLGHKPRKDLLRFCCESQGPFKIRKTNGETRNKSESRNSKKGSE